MRITGTFLDEISYDIPHQNWGLQEWECDFQAMRSIGIDTVILIRCGLRRNLSYPSKVLIQQENAIPPFTDLVDLFLTLAERYGMAFYFGTYEPLREWNRESFRGEVALAKAVIEEAFCRYGHRKAFQGWYLSSEVSRATGHVTDGYAEIGRYCKTVSGGLPVLISPYIQGVKANRDLGVDEASIDVAEHEREWDRILGSSAGDVDIVAFQDGHVEVDELADYLLVNSALAKKYGMKCWTNCETFDRDMPIRFLPLKWEKMLYKLNAALAAGVEKAITFEFSHFMSPNSSYRSANHLFNRYCEHFGLSAAVEFPTQ